MRPAKEFPAAREHFGQTRGGMLCSSHEQKSSHFFSVRIRDFSSRRSQKCSKEHEHECVRNWYAMVCWYSSFAYAKGSCSMM